MMRSGFIVEDKSAILTYPTHQALFKMADNSQLLRKNYQEVIAFAYDRTTMDKEIGLEDKMSSHKASTDLYARRDLQFYFFILKKDIVFENEKAS